MKRKFIEVALEMNGKLIADAAFCKFGAEATKLLMKPAEGNIPKELLPLVNSPWGKLVAAFGISYAAEVYGIPGLDSVARAVCANAATESTNALLDMCEKCLTRENEVLALPAATPAEKVVPASSMAAANTTKGSKNVVQSGFLAVENKVKEILSVKANTTEGNENVIEGELVEDTPYWPVKPEELLTDSNNLCICPNPIEGKAAHSRQRNKFQPYKAKNLNGYRDDLDGLMICGGCRVDLETAYGKDKAKLDAEKKLAEAQTKIDNLTEEYDNIEEKIVKAKGTQATYIKLCTDDPSNEDHAESLKNVQEKIKKLTAQQENIGKQVEDLEALLDKAADGNVKRSTPPVVSQEPVNNVASGPKPEVKVIVPVQANAKQPSGAAARIKGKKNK